MFSEVFTGRPSRYETRLYRRLLAPVGLLVAALLPSWAPASLPVANPGVVIPEPEAMRSVECGRVATQPEATTLITQLIAAGYGPVWQRTREHGSIQVLVGKCEYLADAIWLRNSLRRTAIRTPPSAPSGILKGSELAETQVPDDGLLYPKVPIIPPRGSRVGQSIEGTSLLPSPSAPTSQDAATSMTLLNAAVAEGRCEQPRFGFPSSTIPTTTSTRAPDGGQCAPVRAGGGKALPVIDKFLQVARGAVSAPPSDQLEARWLVADSWHYYYFKPLKARKAYQEIITLHGTDAKVRARAMTEIVASMLELARSQQATFDEVRRACQELHSTVPLAYDRAHAVADLINAETYFYDGKFEDAITRFEALITAYPERPRETAMAHLYLAEAAYRADNWTLAKQHYEAVLAYDFSDPNECFYWMGERWNLKKRAADNLLFKAKEQGDTETAATYETYIQDESYLAGTPSDNPAFDKAYPHCFYERTSNQ